MWIKDVCKTIARALQAARRSRRPVRAKLDIASLMMPRIHILIGVVCCLPGLLAQQKPAAPASEMEKAVDEFKIQTRTLGLRPDSPAKSRNGGVKPAWHGRLYENFRNDILDAVPHEIRQVGGDKSLLRRNQFGFNVTGPVVIPRLYNGGRNTFFSLSYEGVRERISRTYLRTIPIEPERTGDFSQTVDQSGAPLGIYDPASTRLNPDFDPSQPVSLENLQYQRDLFPGGRIPQSRLDPVAVKALEYYPKPNTAIGPFFRNNYFINAPETNTANGMIGKLDHSLNEHHRITTELAFSNGFLGSAQWFPSAANPGPADRNFASRRGSIDHTFTVSSQTVNTFTFAASTDSSTSGDLSGQDYTPGLGLSGASGPAFPMFYFQPYLSMGRSYSISKYAGANYVWSDGISIRRGKHSLRFVGEHILYQVNSYQPQYPSAYLRFTAGLTSLPGIVETGHAFASYLLGLSDYAERSMVASPSYFRRSYSLLVARDRYELRKGLTLSISTTLTRRTPRTEKYDRQSTVDLSVIDPVTGGRGALVFANQNGYGHAFQRTMVNADSSAGIAWNPWGSPKSVVRAGFSRSYGMVPLYSGQWGTQGYNAYPTYISPNVQLDPAVTLGQGFPPYPYGLPDLRPNAANDTTADLINLSGNVPVYQSASLTLERELPASVVVSLGASYSGGKNLFLGSGGANPNAIPLDALQYRDQLNDEDFNRSLRPYPQFKGFDIYSSWPLGRYQRNETWASVEKRTSRGLSFTASYTFAKQMDDYSGPYGKQDYFNRNNEWSVTAGYVPHVFRATYVYELPMGANKLLFRYQDWRRYLVDGWSVTGVAAVQSGNPIYPRPQYNNTGGVVQALRVNVVPGVDPAVANPGPDLWFNPAAFDQPADFTIGDGPRTSNLLTPGYQNYDLTVNKRMALSPERALEFSLAGFNFTNHANWNDPDMVIGPADRPNVNAGKIIGSHGGRVIQLGLRLSF